MIMLQVECISQLTRQIFQCVYGYEVQSLNPVTLRRLLYNKVFESDYNRVSFLLFEGLFVVTDATNIES
jgi:hypothetical protein